MANQYAEIDLAKNVFTVHGVDEHGKVALLRPGVPRGRLHQLVVALKPCTIGMEACSGAHHWARLFAQHGHTVRLMAPKFVAPYRMSGKRGKNDRRRAGDLRGDAATEHALHAVEEPGRASAPVHRPLVSTIGNARLQERPSAPGLARPGARSIQLGWQARLGNITE